MTTIQIFYLGLIFFAVFGVALFGARLLSPDRMKTRLQDAAGQERTSGTGVAQEWLGKIVKVASPLARLSLPEDGWESSPLRLRFMHAGLRDASAPAAYFAAKTLLAVVLPTLLFFYTSLKGTDAKPSSLLALYLVVAAIGYYLPNFVLGKLIFYRQREIFENFPDALDLMTVSIEAGLAVDAAMSRVADEMHLKSEALSEELRLVTLELRAGNSKERALRNLALRTGVEDVDTLVAMLIQAERFGTSVADSLRVHADTLRTKRRLRAEEAAAKIPLKLLFPLIFCVFPSLLLVLMGPAFIQVTKALKAINGQ